MSTSSVRWLVLFGVLLAGPPSRAEDSYVEAALGQHFTGKISGPWIFPLLALRSGITLSDRSTLRLSLGGGGTEVRGSSQPAYDGARLMVGDASLAWLYTLLGREAVRLYGGLETGFWFAALWGKNDGRLSAGSGQRYLEQLAPHYGLLLGLSFPLGPSWAMTVESRLNAAMTAWDGTAYNTGGLSVLLGLMRSLGPAAP